MKKIFSFLLAGIVALSFAGCAGDLHDYGDAPNPTLSAGAVPGAFNSWTNTTAWTTSDDSTHVYTYTFTATAAEIEWKAITTSGDWNSGAYGGTSDAVTSVAVGGTSVALTYDNKSGGYNNAKLTGLTIGSGYKLTVYCSGGVVYAKVETVATPLSLIDNRTFYVQGDFNSWSKGALTLSSSTSTNIIYTYTFTASAASHEFGLATDGWGTKYTGAILALAGDYVQLTKGADANNKITGLTSGSSYTITFKTDTSSNIYAKVAAN